MPRPLPSDEEDSEVEEIQPRKSATKDIPMRDADNASASDDDANGIDGDDADADADEGDDGEEEEYVVEKIRGHDWFPEEKVWKYETIWQGFSDPSDYTWEPAEHLEGAQELLDEYFERIGGNPSERFPNGPEKKKRGRKSTGGGASEAKVNKKARSESSTPSATTPSSTTKRKKRNTEEIEDPENWGPGAPEGWSPPAAKKDAWEDLIENVETIEPDKQGNKFAYLRWIEKDNKGHHRKTRENLYSVYRAAPQAMLKFYERHLVFGNPSKSDG